MGIYIFSNSKYSVLGETMQHTNPLQQYFRRPAVYLKLPSGGVGYPEGALDLPDNGELPIYPMTAIDEITARTPDALFNGTAVTEIIRSCVPNIKDPWAVSNIDLDPILVAIKAATNEGEMEISSECPKCSEESKFGVNLSGVLAGFRPGDYTKVLTIGQDVQIKFKPLSFKLINHASVQQFQFQKFMQSLSELNEEDRNEKSKNILLDINKIANELISESIEYVKVPTATVMEKEFIIEFLANCDKNTYERIKEHNIKLRESTETKPLEIKCPSCSNEYKQAFSINVSDFFD